MRGTLESIDKRDVGVYRQERRLTDLQDLVTGPESAVPSCCPLLVHLMDDDGTLKLEKKFKCLIQIQIQAQSLIDIPVLHV